MLERWPQVCRRIKITGVYITTDEPFSKVVSTETNAMKCLVNWIPLRIRVRRSRNAQPPGHLAWWSRRYAHELSHAQLVDWSCVAKRPKRQRDNGSDTETVDQEAKRPKRKRDRGSCVTVSLSLCLCGLFAHCLMHFVSWFPETGLRVVFLLKTDSGYPEDAGVCTNFANPGNPLPHNTPRSAPLCFLSLSSLCLQTVSLIETFHTEMSPAEISQRDVSKISGPDSRRTFGCTYPRNSGSLL